MILRSLNRSRAQAGDGLSPWTKNAAWAAVAFGLLLLLVLVWAYWVNWARYSRAQDQIDARIARIDGVLASSAEIDAKLTEARQSIRPWLHQGGGDSQNEILQRLRELVVASGATLVSSQAAAVPAEGDQPLSRVKISATVSGDWAQLVSLGQTLQAQRPPYMVRSMNFQREGQVNGKTSQKARMTVQLEAPVATLTEIKP